MAIKDDPSLYKSEWERTENDRYWTEPAVSAALARRIPAGVTSLWEPAGGRGDLARVIKDFGYNVFASDIDPSEFDTSVCQCETVDFLSGDTPSFFVDESIDMIATNPPFGDNAERFARVALGFEHIRVVALLLRSEWKHGKKRLDLFTDPKHHYCKEIVLTWRPRWDWWFRDKPVASPRHNYSWFVFDRLHNGPATQEFATRTN